MSVVVATLTNVMPAKAGIQYAAAPAVIRRRRCLLGPRLRGNDHAAGQRA